MVKIDWGYLIPTVLVPLAIAATAWFKANTANKSATRAHGRITALISNQIDDKKGKTNASVRDSGSPGQHSEPSA